MRVCSNAVNRRGARRAAREAASSEQACEQASTSPALPAGDTRRPASRRRARREVPWGGGGARHRQRGAAGAWLPAAGAQITDLAPGRTQLSWLTRGVCVLHTGCCQQDAQGSQDAAAGTGDSALDTAAAEAEALAHSVDAFEEDGDDLAPVDARTLVTSVTTAVNDRPVVRGVLISGAVFLGVTFLFSCYKVFLRFNSNRSKRRRQVGKNLVVVDALAKYLPGQRERLSPAVVRALCVRTGFSRDSVFRKMLRFLLAERPFDNDALLDVVALRDACGLSDSQLAEVLLDTAERSRKQTGVLMRRPSGMTAEGLARKAQGRALFSKLLFLCEHESLLTAPGEREAAAAALCKTFGATADDADALRIPSLSALTPEDLERLWGGGSAAAEGGSDTSADE